MRGSDFVASLPDTLAAREAAILETVRADTWTPALSSVVVDGHDRHLELRVMSQSFRIGEDGDAVRINVSHTLAQQIADLLGMRLPTAKILDLVHAQARVQLRACVGGHGADMGSNKRMLEHSRQVDAALLAAGAAPDDLVSTVGKDWVNTNRLLGQPGRGANYGWHDVGAAYASASNPGLKVWQPVGLAHDRIHADYSQTLRLVHPIVLVDGVELELDAVLQDPVLAPLLSHEGRLGVRRHPGVIAPGATARAVFAAAAPPTVPEAVPPFLQAKNFRPGPRPGGVNWIVVHTMEAPETHGTALNVAKWFAGLTRVAAPVASAHYCVDAETTVQCVREEDIAFAAPGANEAGVHIEHAGFARQSAEDWADDYSEAMLRRSAMVAAGACERWDVPFVFVDAAALQRGERGITTHAEVSQAWHRTTHTDPGPAFPMQHYLELCLEVRSGYA